MRHHHAPQFAHEETETQGGKGIVQGHTASERQDQDLNGGYTGSLCCCAPLNIFTAMASTTQGDRVFHSPCTCPQHLAWNYDNRRTNTQSGEKG